MAAIMIMAALFGLFYFYDKSNHEKKISVINKREAELEKNYLESQLKKAEAKIRFKEIVHRIKKHKKDSTIEIQEIGPEEHKFSSNKINYDYNFFTIIKARYFPFWIDSTTIYEYHELYPYLRIKYEIMDEYADKSISKTLIFDNIDEVSNEEILDSYFKIVNEKRAMWELFQDTKILINYDRNP